MLNNKENDLSAFPLNASYEKAEKVLNGVANRRSYFPTKWLLKEESLSDWIIKDLRKSGIDDKHIKKMGIEPVLEQKQLDSLNISRKVAGASWMQNTEGYFIPYLQTKSYARVKLRDKLGEQKYISPSGESHLYFLPEDEKLFTKTKSDLWIVEGEKKAVAVKQYVGEDSLVVGCPGVTIWKNTPEFEKLALKNRNIYIVFDRAEGNAQVEKQLISMYCYMLKKQQSNPNFIFLPPEYPKVDDFLARGDNPNKLKAKEKAKRLEELKSLATKQLFASLKNTSEKDLAHYLNEHRISDATIEKHWEKQELSEIFGITCKTFKQGVAEDSRAKRSKKYKYKEKEIKRIEGDDCEWIIGLDFIDKKFETKIAGRYTGSHQTSRIIQQRVEIVDVYEDIKTGETRVRISKNGRVIDSYFSQEDVTMSSKISVLARKGVKVKDAYKKDLAQYFGDMIDLIEYKESCTANGFDSEGSFILGSEKIKDDGRKEKIEFMGEAYVPESEGDFAAWNLVLKKFNNDPQISFVAGASAISPFLKFIGCKSYTFHTWGGSSSGKSFATDIAASMWGDPERIKELWDQSKSGFETYFEESGGLPKFLEESQECDPKIVVNTVYTIGNEKGRGRATFEEGRIKRRKSVVFHGVNLSTGETKISTLDPLRKGAVGRLVEMMRQPIAENLDMARQVDFCKMELEENHGLCGEKIISFFLKNKDIVKERFKYYKKELQNSCTESDSRLQLRQIPYVASILTGCWILNKIGVEIYESMEQLEFMAQSLIENASQETVGESAINYIDSVSNAHPDKFCEGALESIDNREIWGRLDETEDYKIVHFFPHVLKKTLQEGGFDISVMDILHREGKTKHAKSRKKNNVKVHKKQSWVYSIIVRGKKE